MCARAWDHLAGNGDDRAVFLLPPWRRIPAGPFMTEPRWFFSFLFSSSLTSFVFFRLAMDDDNTHLLSSARFMTMLVSSRGAPSVSNPCHLIDFFLPSSSRPSLCLSCSSAVCPSLCFPARLPSVSRSGHSSHLHLPPRPSPPHFPIRTPTVLCHAHPPPSLPCIVHWRRFAGIAGWGRFIKRSGAGGFPFVCVLCKRWVLRPSHGWQKTQRR
ncbi:hypothetical protein V8C44DRAFT_316597 [Trichoderma aethiopicum]